MNRPVVCSECDRIVVAKSGQKSCPHCGNAVKTGSLATESPSDVGRSDHAQPGLWSVFWNSSDEMKWSLSLIAIGIGFLVWSLISPETTLKKKTWLSGDGIPVGSTGAFFLAFGMLSAFILGFVNRKEKRD